MEVPKWLIKLHNKVFISVDVMFTSRMTSMVSVLRNIKFNAIQNLENRNKATLLGGIDVIIVCYRKGVFNTNNLLIDQDFNATEGDIFKQHINFNPTSSKENVGDIEKMIQAYKERIHARCSSLLFRKIPRVMICDTVEDALT